MSGPVLTVGHPFAFRCGCGWKQEHGADPEVTIAAVRAHLDPHAGERDEESR